MIMSLDIGIYVLYWDTCHCIGIRDNASSHVITYATWTTQIHSPSSIGSCIHTHALLSLLGPHVGIINALDELVTNYGGGYRLLFGPWDDMA
jgi:hypothetical protein